MKIRNLNELRALKQGNLHRVHLRELGEAHDEVTEIRVHMADPHAQELLAFLTASAKQENLRSLRVVAMPGLDASLEVHEPSGRTTKYIEMDKAKTAEMLEQHLLGGEPVAAYAMEGDVQ